MDHPLSVTYDNTREFLKCILVGLLCIQEDSVNHPTILNILSMLGNENAFLLASKIPKIVADGCLAASKSKNLYYI